MIDLDELTAYAQRWIVLHRENKYQREAAKIMHRVVDALKSVRAERDAALARIAEAATEQHDPKNLSIMNGWLVEEVGEHTCGAGPDGYYGAHEPGCGYDPLVNLSELPGYPDEEKWGVALGDMTERAQKAEAERDAALAAIERVRAIHERQDDTDGQARRGGCARWWQCPTIQALDEAAQGAAPQAESADCDRDRMGICKRCGMGWDARKVLDGDFACPALRRRAAETREGKSA